MWAHRSSGRSSPRPSTSTAGLRRAITTRPIPEGPISAPSNAKFIEEVAKRIARIRQEDGLAPTAPVPADLVLASASGLDPDISLEAALLQAERVAKARGLSRQRVSALVLASADHLYGPGSREMVNVLDLNLSLDALEKR